LKPPFLLRFKRYSRLPRYIQQVIHHRFQQRDSLFASDRFRLSLRIAGNQRAVGARGGLGVAEDVNPVVDLFFELVLIDKPSIWSAPKKWPMPLPKLRRSRSFIAAAGERKMAV